MSVAAHASCTASAVAAVAMWTVPGRAHTAVVAPAGSSWILHFDHVDACQATARHVAEIECEPQWIVVQVQSHILVILPLRLLVVLHEVKARVALHSKHAIRHGWLGAFEVISNPPDVWMAPVYTGCRTVRSLAAHAAEQEQQRGHVGKRAYRPPHASRAALLAVLAGCGVWPGEGK